MLSYFYYQLHAVQVRLPKGEVAIMMADLSAKAGSDNTLLGYGMGKHAPGHRNDNGGRLVHSVASRASSLLADFSSVGFQLTDTVQTIRFITLRSAEDLGHVSWMYIIKVALTSASKGITIQ